MIGLLVAAYAIVMSCLMATGLNWFVEAYVGLGLSGFTVSVVGLCVCVVFLVWSVVKLVEWSLLYFLMVEVLCWVCDEDRVMKGHEWNENHRRVLA
jgi:hypothetical protein